MPLLTLIFIGVAPLISVAQNPSDGPAEAEAAPIVIDMAAPLEPERAPPPPTEPSALGVYRSYIESMETNGGAFAPGLTEQLLGLGLNLQALDRHAEAAKVLKRGVHVSRVQSGLYAADQIPLLRAEIRSLIALGRFDEVDEHQRYLARVESEALTGTPASIAALIDQGEWAEQAWDLRLGDQEAHPRASRAKLGVLPARLQPEHATLRRAIAGTLETARGHAAASVPVCRPAAGECEQQPIRWLQLSSNLCPGRRLPARRGRTVDHIWPEIGERLLCWRASP